MIQATARRSSFHAQGARAFYRGNPVYTQAAPLRIGLRLWGIDEYEVLCWGERLPTLGERIVWDIVHDPDSDDAGMVIHLVRSSAATLGSFCWNCVGANRAMYRATRSSSLNVAVFSGDPRRLPTPRYGLWAMAGRRSEAETVHEVVRTLVFPCMMDTR